MPHLYYCLNPTDGRSPSEVASFEHDLGRRLLAYGLREQYDLFFSEDDLSFGPKGKPYLSENPEIHFSISHCRGLVVCALNDKPIGADAEAPRKRIFASIKRRILSAEEQAFLDRFSDDPAL